METLKKIYIILSIVGLLLIGGCSSIQPPGVSISSNYINVTASSVNLTFPNPINTSEKIKYASWYEIYNGNNQRKIVIDTLNLDANYILITANGTGTNTITIYGSSNKIQNYTLTCRPLGGGAQVTTITANGHWICPTVNRYIILGTTAYTSGARNILAETTNKDVLVQGNTMTVSGSVSVSTTTNIPSTGQGSSTHHTQLINSTQYLKSVKTGVGVIGSLCVSNANTTSPYYLKMYNKASAPAPATDTPVFVYIIPANSNYCLNMGSWGVRYTTGIAYSVVKNVAKTDSTAPNNNLVSVNIAYT